MLSKRVKRQLTEFVITLLVIALSTLFLFKFLESRNYGKDHIENNESRLDIPSNNVVVLGAENKDIDIVHKDIEKSKGVDRKKILNKVKIASIDKNKHPIKKSASSVMQEKIDYAWNISKDESFIYTIEAENGAWDETTISRTGDYGVCQINKASHPEVVRDKNFKDWKWQVRKCWDFYKGGVRFYGHDRIGEMVDRFEWID